MSGDTINPTPIPRQFISSSCKKSDCSVTWKTFRVCYKMSHFDSCRYCESTQKSCRDVGFLTWKWFNFIWENFSTNTCQTGLYALHWSCQVLTVGWRVNQSVLQSHFSQIIETQALLLTTVVAAGIEKRSTKAFNLVSCENFSERDLL